MMIMQIVINISNTLKQIADEEDTKTFSNIVWQAILMDAIKNGTVLPEKHGRIIDMDKLCKDLIKRWKTADKKKEIVILSVMADVVTPIIVSQPTILEATEGIDEKGLN